jgi:hypothetical protein
MCLIRPRHALSGTYVSKSPEVILYLDIHCPGRIAEDKDTTEKQRMLRSRQTH